MDSQGQAEICKGSSGTVTTCAITMAPSNSYVLVGRSLQLHAISTATGKEFSMPSALHWSITSGGSSGATLSTAGLLNAGDIPDNLNVRVSTNFDDSATGSVRVVLPVIGPQRESVVKGGQLTFALVDPEGRPFPDTAGWTWTSSTPAVLSIDPLTGSAAAVSVGGPVTVTALDSISKQSVSASLMVVDSQSHWEGSYDISDCTATPSQWIVWWNDPCFVALPLPSGLGGKFYFEDNSSGVVFESHPWMNADGVRSVAPISWRSDDAVLSHSISTKLHFDWTTGSADQRVPSTHNEEGPLTFRFTVTSRTPDLILGTFLATFKVGFGTPPYGNFTVQPGAASGSWSMRRVSGPRPDTQMKGFEFCASFSNTAYSLNPFPNEFSNPDVVPALNNFANVPDGCKYQ
jgi:hypothetical protein